MVLYLKMIPHRSFNHAALEEKRTPVNRKVNTPSKETVMRPAVFELGFKAFKMLLQP